MQTHDDWGESGTNTERLVFFSDAVFAIAITLLALEIKIPEVAENIGARQHILILLDLWPKVLSFLISFIAIGIYWMAHHRMFKYIERYDRRLLWLNFYFLLCIACMPIVTAVLDAANADTVSVAVYAGLLTITGLVQWALWRHATSGHRLVAADLDQRIIAYNTGRALLGTAVFVVSIGVAFINPNLAMVTWLLLFLTRRVLKWYLRREHPQADRVQSVHH